MTIPLPNRVSAMPSPRLTFVLVRSNSPIGSADFEFSPMLINLRTAFGTSHSVSSTRTNGLLRLDIVPVGDLSESRSICAFGEAGLPPLKVGCYEGTISTLNDTLQEFQDWSLAHFPGLIPHSIHLDESCFSYDFLSKVPSVYFTELRAFLLNSTRSEIWLISGVFYLLDRFLAEKRQVASDMCFLSLIEATLFDALGKVANQSISHLIFAMGSETDVSVSLTRAIQHVQSFYTVGMDSMDEMLRNLDFGLQSTGLIKIKVDDDVKKLSEVLPRFILAAQSKTGTTSTIPINLPALFSIDANSAWKKAEIAFDFLPLLLEHKSHLAMVEQPFPLFRVKSVHSVRVNVNSFSAETTAISSKILDAVTDTISFEQFKASLSGALGDSLVATVVENGEYKPVAFEVLFEWMLVAVAYARAGIYIFADESACNSNDLILLRFLAHGINIKLEKAGGFRNGLRMIFDASNAVCKTFDSESPRPISLRSWIGCMVGSNLNSTQASHLLAAGFPSLQVHSPSELSFDCDQPMPFCWGDLDGSLLSIESSNRYVGGMLWPQSQPSANAERINFESLLSAWYTKYSRLPASEFPPLSGCYIDWKLYPELQKTASYLERVLLAMPRSIEIEMRSSGGLGLVPRFD